MSNINYSNKWNYEEEVELYELFLSKMPLSEISKKINRTRSVIGTKKEIFISNLLNTNDFNEISKISYI